MTKTKHTEAPWHVTSRSLSDYEGHEIGTHNQTVCVTTTAERLAVSAEERANADLLASAPELLHALTAVRDAGYLDGAYQPTVDLVDAAIAKARGNA